MLSSELAVEAIDVAAVAANNSCIPAGKLYRKDVMRVVMLDEPCRTLGVHVHVSGDRAVEVVTEPPSRNLDALAMASGAQHTLSTKTCRRFGAVHFEAVSVSAIGRKK